jgi:hypothetical protein
MLIVHVLQRVMSHVVENNRTVLARNDKRPDRYKTDPASDARLTDYS